MEETEHQHQQQPEEPPKRVPPMGAGNLRRGFIRLRRDETCVQWGFRIIGGTDFDEPITIVKVTRESLAFKKGLRPGDVILKVCGNLLANATNEMAKMEILRAGNELDLVIERDLTKNIPQPQPKPRRHRAGPMEDFPATQFVNPNLQSKSFNILRETLDRLGSLSPSQEGQPIVFQGAQVQQPSYAPPEAPAPVATYTPPAQQAPPSPQVHHAPQHVQEDHHAPQHVQEDHHAPQHVQEDHHAPQHVQEDHHAPQHVQEHHHAPQAHEEPAEDEYDYCDYSGEEEDYNGYDAPEIYVPPEERSHNHGYSTPPENDAGHPTENTIMEYRPHYSEDVTEPRG